jgi:hypothetical protein
MYQGNQHIFTKIHGIQQILMGVHSSGGVTSAATKGREREEFVNKFLSNILPPQFRFGSGDITDLSGIKSGQIDIVVEYPLLPSLETPGVTPRLYLAEGVAAAIEVKSNLRTQWDEVEATSKQLRSLRRKFGARTGIAPTHVPLFAVGYEGWKKLSTLEDYLAKNVVDGLLVIDEGFFIWNSSLLPVAQFSTGSATGAWALWALIVVLHQLAISLENTSLDLALYARQYLVILQKICNEANNDESIQVPFFDVTEREGIDKKEAKEMLNFLEKEKLVKLAGVDLDGIVTITRKAIEETEHMLTLF